MTTSLEARVTRLEEIAGGGGECGRCVGSVVVIANGEVEAVSFANGRKLTPEEAQAFEREEEEANGRCPVCGGEREKITVGSWS
jgi:hypothetical protein